MIGVGDVVNHPDAVFRAMATTFSKNSSSTHCVVGLAGKLRTSIFGRGHGSLMAFSISSKKFTPASWGCGGCRRRRSPAVDMDRVARIGHQHDIARIQRGQGQMGDALLGADGDDGLFFRIEVDVVAALYQLQMARRSAGCLSTPNSDGCRRAGRSRSAFRRCAAASAGRDCPCRSR
jgi:hypothetical protein